MGRSPRMEESGTSYHVIQRGNNREQVFDSARDKACILEQINNAATKDGAEIFAYVIMSNHYHLALRTGTEPLSKIMHRINTKYSHYYNKKYQRTGHVFDGRYKAIPIEDENYFLSVIRYIHRNPVRAKICSRAEDYPWSSDRHYREGISAWVNNQMVLAMLSGEKDKALQKYNLLMTEADEPDYSEASYIGKQPAQLKTEPELTKPGRKPLEEILRATGVGNREFDAIKEGARRRGLIPFKTLYAKQALAEGYSMKEIGEYIGISATAIQKYALCPNIQ